MHNEITNLVREDKITIYPLSTDFHDKREHFVTKKQQRLLSLVLDLPKVVPFFPKMSSRCPGKSTASRVYLERTEYASNYFFSPLFGTKQ
jgi:hypothetical protein